MGLAGGVMIRNVSLKNFKSLRNIQLELERLTVFVGPNASGKSSILQGLNLLCSIFQKPQIQPSGPEEVSIAQAVTRGVKDAPELAVVTDENWYRYSPLFPGPPKPPNIGGKAPFQGDGRDVAARVRPGAWTPWKFPSNNLSPLPRSALLQLEASKLIPAVSASPDPTVMAANGVGLHSALASMALNDPDSWLRLQADLKQIITSIRRLRHTKAPSPPQVPSLLFDTLAAEALPASQVSEGTLLVLGLLAALYSADRPNLILLDDLDRGLHPKAQKELVSLLRELLKTDPNLQILATTHSPYMLDSMDAKEVRMTFLQDDGTTVCAPLMKHPKFEKWKDEMAPGEMWSLFGEKWMAQTETEQ